MKTLPLDQIQISPDRQRRNFDLKELNGLGESIKKNGLFHPIVLRYEQVPDTYQGGGYILVSGERRLRAISDLYALGDSFSYDSTPVPVGEIPYVSLGELDVIAREEAELEENIRRIDLSWQERAAATSRLMKLREAQALAAGTAAPSVAGIAVEVRGSAEGIHHETTRRELIVAKHLDDPEVAAAKGVDEAFKVLKRKEETGKRVALAAEVGRTYSAETAHSIHNEEASIFFLSCPSEQFDVILTDPPYGISADEFGDSGGHAAGPHFYEDSYENWQALIARFAVESFRITKPQAHLYCFCDITRFEELKQVLAAAGWQPFRTPIIWHKPNGNRLPWVDSGPQRKYELVLYAKKGGKLTTRIYPDLVTYPADENLGHHAQKPVALYIDLLRRSVAAGDKVLDPFAGSGPILPAANELKLRATAIERDPAAYGICIRRLEQLKDQPELEGL